MLTPHLITHVHTARKFCYKELGVNATDKTFFFAKCMYVYFLFLMPVIYNDSLIIEGHLNLTQVREYHCHNLQT
jgi:hypothetical protein